VAYRPLCSLFRLSLYQLDQIGANKHPSPADLCARHLTGPSFAQQTISAYVQELRSAVDVGC
jgi:hypothetical protein